MNTLDESQNMRNMFEEASNFRLVRDLVSKFISVSLQNDPHQFIDIFVMNPNSNIRRLND